MTYRLTLHLNSGQTLVALETFPEDIEEHEVRDSVHQTVFPAERPASPYREFGDDILVHYQNIAAIEVEPLAA